MITINLMIVFKVISLIILGFFLIFFFIKSFNNEYKSSSFIGFFLYLIPFIYILIN